MFTITIGRSGRKGDERYAVATAIQEVYSESSGWVSPEEAGLVIAPGASLWDLLHEVRANPHAITSLCVSGFYCEPNFGYNGDVFKRTFTYADWSIRELDRFAKLILRRDRDRQARRRKQEEARRRRLVPVQLSLKL